MDYFREKKISRIEVNKCDIPFNFFVETNEFLFFPEVYLTCICEARVSIIIFLSLSLLEVKFIFINNMYNIYDIYKSVCPSVGWSVCHNF